MWPEWPGDEAWITVTRTGGSASEASAAFATGGGTANPGSDYGSLTTHVRFADGEEGTRVVLVPIIADNIAEPDETVSMTLSSPGGCAALGGLTSAELMILDDDRPLPAAYMIGGTVMGLEGTGLRLRNIASAADAVDELTAIDEASNGSETRARAPPESSNALLRGIHTP